MAPLLLLLACTGEPPTSKASARPALDSWIGDLAADPEAFGALMEAEPKQAWIALHANDLHGAYQGFSGSGSAGEARTAALLARLHASLDRTLQRTNASIAQLRNERGLEPSDGLLLYTAISACDADALALQVPQWPKREALLSGNRAEALTAALVTPIIVEPAAGFERTYFEPCGYSSLARIWSERASDAPSRTEEQGGPGVRTALSDLLFSPYLTRADQHLTPADTSPSAAALGIEPITGQATRQAAREQVRALALGVQAHQESTATTATEQGAALLDELHLFQRFQHDWLTLRAEQWARIGQVEPALAMLEQTIDVAQPGVGPHNSPLTLALLAETHLSTGHTREALHALQRLSKAHPEVKGLQERVGDLAVLEGLGRHGDSKED